MDDEKVLIKTLKVEYITTKIDAYENELCYFKFRDKNIDSKLAVLIKEGFKYPWFKSDKGQTIFKTKKKYMKLKETSKEEIVIVDMSFTFYKMNDNEGYYVCGIV